MLLFKTRKRLPSFRLVVEDIPFPLPVVAKYLGVSPSTLYRWLAADRAPRPAHLALYWCTKWGESDFDLDLFERANLYQNLAASLQSEVSRLRGYLSQLGHIGEFGSANDPLPLVPLAPLPDRPFSDLVTGRSASPLPDSFPQDKDRYSVRTG